MLVNQKTYYCCKEANSLENKLKFSMIPTKTSKSVLFFDTGLNDSEVQVEELT